jgi:hypothetical protein
LSFQGLSRRIGLRFVCLRVTIVFIATTAVTDEKFLDFHIEFAAKTPGVAHIVCIALRCARALRRNVESGPGMPGLEMRMLKAEARECVRKKVHVLAKETGLTRPRLRGGERCGAHNVTSEPNMAMRRLGM